MNNAPTPRRTARFWYATLAVSLGGFFALAVICSGIVAAFNWLVQSGQARWLMAAFPLILGAVLLVLSIGYAVREYLNGEELAEPRGTRRSPLRSISARTGTHYVRLRTPQTTARTAAPALRAAAPVTALPRRR